jgi:hypothetical protein
MSSTIRPDGGSILPTPPWRNWRALAAHLAVAVITGIAPSLAETPPSLPAAVAQAVREQIGPVLEQEGVTSVGVLKFLAVDGDEPGDAPTTRLGAINADLAAQFQTAILLNVARKHPFAVLRDPGKVATAVPGASHLSVEGQAKLFAADYPVVVGAPGDTVKPDAFLFGIIDLAPGLETVTVDVRMIRRGSEEVRNLCSFRARFDAHDLTAAGRSYAATRGLFDGGKALATVHPADAGPTDRAAVLALAADVKAGRRPFPLEDPEAPVTFSIAYDGAVQPIDFRGGEAFVAEPRPAQKVVVTIGKVRRDGRRYGVVLKVNGENTAERTVLPDVKSMKWILSDDFMSLPVKGYSVGDSLEPFVVVSEAESARRAFDYGVDAGTITMAVFAERPDAPADAPVPLVRGNAGGTLDELLLAGGVRLDSRRTFGTLDEAKAALRTALGNKSRGLVVPGGESRPFKKNLVAFATMPDPVMSVVVRYSLSR